LLLFAVVFSYFFENKCALWERIPALLKKRYKF
jgi:hypothetical protein